MEDRELLEAAAKAAGIVLDTAKQGEPVAQGAHARILADQVYFYHRASHPLNVSNKDGNVKWNPLEDDGDALRLAVKLKLEIIHHSDDLGCYAGTANREYGSATYFEGKKADRLAAVRRAIVKAAAEIGKSVN